MGLHSKWPVGPDSKSTLSRLLHLTSNSYPSLASSWLPSTRVFAGARRQHSKALQEDELEADHTSMQNKSLPGERSKEVEAITGMRKLGRGMSGYTYQVRWSNGDVDWQTNQSVSIPQEKIAEFRIRQRDKNQNKTAPIRSSVDLLNSPVSLSRLIEVQQKNNGYVEDAVSYLQGREDHRHNWTQLQVADTLTWTTDLNAAIAAVKAKDADEAAHQALGTLDKGSGLGSGVDTIGHHRREADLLLQQAEAAALTAQKFAAKAHEQRALYDSLRSEFEADLERNPTYLDPSGEEYRKRFRARLQTGCRICEGTNHVPTTCPFLIPDNNLGHKFSSSVALRVQARLTYDEQFRAAFAYLKKTVPLVMESAYDENYHNVRPTTQSHYSNPPPAAIPILQKFDRRVWFRSIMKKDIPTPRYRPRISLVGGHYRTFDDDGRPLVILWQHGAPSQLNADAKEEIRLYRTFAAQFNSGARSLRRKSKPPEEACPVGIIIASAGWHTSFSTIWKENCLRIQVASKLTWSQGLALGSLHLTTITHELDGEFAGWQSGKVLQGSRRDFMVAGVRRRDLLRPGKLASLLRASLRNIEEPVEPIFVDDLGDGNRAAKMALWKWREDMRSRARLKYGANSVQERLVQRRVKHGADNMSAVEDSEASLEEQARAAVQEEELLDTPDEQEDLLGSDREVMAKMAGLPDFETIMALGSQQEPWAPIRSKPQDAKLDEIRESTEET